MLSLPLAGEIPLYDASSEQLKNDLLTVSRQKLAEQITGGLSYPSKMDCPAWGLPIEHCKTGAKLAEKPGTVCEGCYAAKGSFRFPATQAKLRRAYEGLFQPLWTPAMIQQVRWHAEERFRWFHSGDLQGVTHLRNIIRICLETPWVMHWLPTRERETVLACADELPDNLVIRASGTKDRRANAELVADDLDRGDRWGLLPSSVRGGNCAEHGRDACWDPLVWNVSYAKH